MRPNRKVIISVAATVVAAAVILGLVFRRSGDGSALTASGTVEATEARLGFQATGRIERVVQDRDR